MIIPLFPEDDRLPAARDIACNATATPAQHRWAAATLAMSNSPGDHSLERRAKNAYLPLPCVRPASGAPPRPRATMIEWFLMIVAAVAVGVVLGAWITRGIAGAAWDATHGEERWRG